MGVHNDQNQSKQQLRQYFLQRRQQLNINDWRNRSDQVCKNLHSMPEFQQARCILAFTSFRQEPDLSALYRSVPAGIPDTIAPPDRALTKRWGFSRCVGQELIWHHYQPGFNWQSGAYGISEPSSDWPMVDLSEVDLILVPAIACDRTGGRLGYGGGFYDRFLSRPELKSVVTIGIVFSFAYCDRLPLEEWDQPLNFVCTEIESHSRSRT